MYVRFARLEGYRVVHRMTKALQNDADIHKGEILLNDSLIDSSSSVVSRRNTINLPSDSMPFSILFVAIFSYYEQGYRYLVDFYIGWRNQIVFCRHWML